jgi:hypothetical protein
MCRWIEAALAFAHLHIRTYAHKKKRAVGSSGRPLMASKKGITNKSASPSSSSGD